MEILKKNKLKLFFCFGIIWFANIFYSISVDLMLGINSILFIIGSLLLSLIIKMIFYSLRKENKKILEILKDSILKENNFIFTILFVLLMPAWINYLIVLFGVILVNLLINLKKDGFISVLVIRFFLEILCCYLIKLPNSIPSIDESLSMTFTSPNYIWTNGTIPLDFSVFAQGLLGKYNAPIGESFTLLILVLGIYLFVNKIIDGKYSLIYIGGVFILSFVIALINSYSLFNYSIAHVSLGGVMFVSIFIIPFVIEKYDNKIEKIIFILLAAFLTISLRIIGLFADGVIISLIIAYLVFKKYNTIVKQEDR